MRLCVRKGKKSLIFPWFWSFFPLSSWFFPDIFSFNKIPWHFHGFPDLANTLIKSVKQISSQKHLGMILDNKLNFQEHLKNTLDKVDKTIELLRKLLNILPSGPLLTIYKSSTRPHLDYGNVIYDQHYNSFHQKLEPIQYNATLAIPGAIRGSSREKLYPELGLESLQQRRWFRKLC